MEYKTKNFEFLKVHNGVLCLVASYAEKYIYTDPSSSLVKARQFIEQLVEEIYSKLGLTKPYQYNLNDLLHDDTFKRSVPRVILTKIHGIRKAGNAGAHGDEVNYIQALNALNDTHDVASWYYITFLKGKKEDCGTFSKPEKPEDISEIKVHNKKLEEEKKAQDEKIKELFAELEKTRKAAEENQAKVDLGKILEVGSKAAEVLQFSEEKTRKQQIDRMLVKAGWKISDDGTNTDEVAQEFEVKHQPTNTGIGYVDYVLLNNDGKPMAVIEAKKTSASAEKGKKQAELYADAIEKDYGIRPVIFYSNGFETYIWNDAEKNQPPRRIYDFYSKDSLQYLIFQRTQKLPLNSITVSPEIAGRAYQIEAVKRVCERFSEGHRKALIVQATGTGKTRVAISLCDVMLRAKWAKRILFLCDRSELKRQANNAFKNSLPSEPRIDITSGTSKDKEKRIYLATYPSMMNSFESFDVGFFDLIIADESHRSVYNRYRDIFEYFDAFKVGLTATPVNFVSRNTYDLFGCEDKDPTYYYSFEQAITNKPPYLTDYEVITHTTAFLRRGIKYSELSDEQKQQLEEQVENAEQYEYENDELDRLIHNKSTNKEIIRNLMENGLRGANNSRLGKTIIFARRHEHAVLLEKYFNEMYPQYGGKFCRVIDNYDPRAESLIDDLKDPNHELTIAVSVDMLDTGIDIPEILNLVFAKPVKSYVKFWQMIGRGTRLCPNLFGAGKDKAIFRIFDHWGNFEYFGQKYKQTEPKKQKSVLQRLFEARIQIAEAAATSQDIESFELAIKLIAQDINALPENSISVKEKLREVRAVQKEGILLAFKPTTVQVLKDDVAPLMQWRETYNQDEAYKFDLLIAGAQAALLQKSSDIQSFKTDIVDKVSNLPININQVKDKIETIKKIKTQEFWDKLTVNSLEEIRKEIRDLAKFDDGGGVAITPPVIDVSEDISQIKSELYKGVTKPVDLTPYRKRVEEVLKEMFDDNIVLQKIKNNEPIKEGDIDELCKIIHQQHPDLDLKKIGQTQANIEILIRSIIGLSAEAVDKKFEKFIQAHPQLNAKQVKFLDLLKTQIATYGPIEIAKLYEAPYTNIDSGGFDSIFPDATLATEIEYLINSFKNYSGATLQ